MKTEFYWRTCNYCGKTFSTNDIQRAYCDAKCRTNNFLFKRYGVVHCISCGNKDVIPRGSYIRTCDYCRSKGERTLDSMTPDEQLHYGRTQTQRLTKTMWGDKKI